MGFFGDSKDKAKEKAAEALRWPVEKIKNTAAEKYLKQKGKWVSGTCPQCGNPINASRPGSVHRKCARKLRDEVSNWETKHRSDGSSKSGNFFTDCNCNENWPHHTCKKRFGEDMKKFW